MEVLAHRELLQSFNFLLLSNYWIKVLQSPKSDLLFQRRITSLDALQHETSRVQLRTQSHDVGCSYGRRDSNGIKSTQTWLLYTGPTCLQLPKICQKSKCSPKGTSSNCWSGTCLQAGWPSCHPTNSISAVKTVSNGHHITQWRTHTHILSPSNQSLFPGYSTPVQEGPPARVKPLPFILKPSLLQDVQEENWREPANQRSAGKGVVVQWEFPNRGQFPKRFQGELGPQTGRLKLLEYWLLADLADVIQTRG